MTTSTKDPGPPGARLDETHQERLQPATKLQLHHALELPEPKALQQYLESLAGADAMTMAQAIDAAYQRFCEHGLTADDVLEFQERGEKKLHKRKGAWRRLARFFRISLTEAQVSSGWVWDPEQELWHFIANASVTAIAPWGQSYGAVGSCSTREARFWGPLPHCPACGGAMWDNRGRSDKGPMPFACRNRRCPGTLGDGEFDPTQVGVLAPSAVLRAKATHDCVSTASTRAENRAISNLIAGGEVSAEEIEQHEEGPGRPQEARGGADGQEQGAGGDRQARRTQPYTIGGRKAAPAQPAAAPAGNGGGPREEPPVKTISAAQVKRFWGLAARFNVSKEDARALVAEAGFSDITQVPARPRDTYEGLCEALNRGGGA